MNTANLSIAQACDRAGEECTMPREVAGEATYKTCRMADGRCGICGGDWSVCGCDGMLRRRAALAQTSKEQQ